MCSSRPVERILDRRGRQRISDETDAVDLLVNSAGTDARSFGAAEDDRGPFDFDAQVFNAVFEVNVTGPMLITRHLLPLLRSGNHPMVVNISSQLESMQIATDMGGPEAPLAIDEASTHIATTIESLTVSDSGRFIRWDGRDHPW